MDRELINDMLDVLGSDLEDIKSMVQDLPNCPANTIEDEVEGTYDRKGIVHYIEVAINYLERIAKQINKDDKI